MNKEEKKKLISARLSLLGGILLSISVVFAGIMRNPFIVGIGAFLMAFCLMLSIEIPERMK